MLAALIGRLRGVHDNHKRIASGAVLIGVLVLAAKLFVAAREMAVAWRYGVSGVVDAYQIGLTIATWVPLMLTSTATVVLVPRLVALHRDPPTYRGFVAQLNGSILLLALGIMLLTVLAAPLTVDLLAGALEPETQALVRRMALLLAPVAALSIVAGYLTTRLQARERYGYSVVDATPALVVAVFVLAAPAGNPADPLIWGTLIGFVLQVAWLGAMVHNSDRPIGAFRFRHEPRDWRPLYVPLLVMFLGQLVLTTANPLDQGFASRLGEGAVATLGYANRLVSLIVGFGSVVVARALLPVLSGTVADGETELGARQTEVWSLLLFFVGIAIAVVGWLLAPWAVSLVFERGAFTAEDSAAVAYVLRAALLQLPFYFGGLAVVQWYAASNRHHVLLWVACLALAVKVSMNALLIEPLGLAGLMVATAAMYAVSFAVQLLFVNGKHEKVR
ncbi:MAG: murein biosynthesis integral membrane protein MurJ [Allosphingosinicella sp.]